MPSLDNFLLFIVASVLLVLTPGPNLLYLISRTLVPGSCGRYRVAGRDHDRLSVVHILAAALGLSAVFLAVPLAYDVLRWAGAGYLLWLAWDAVRPDPAAASRGAFAPGKLPDAAPWKLFRMGLLTSILNPKVALFYLALVPAVRATVARQRVAAIARSWRYPDRDSL
jgi:threonine/homoserine/homoserine lactone efflux protein